MQGTYEPWLVILSILVAILASFAALDLASRVVSSRGRNWYFWMAGGAVSMGLGIWSMHFIGMLAFHLPIPIVYEIAWTLGSIVPAVLSSAIALFTIRHGGDNRYALPLAGLVMGLGISAMHYSGMAAIPITPAISYAPVPFTLSIVIAVLTSYTALHLAFQFRRNDLSPAAFRRKLASATVMGFAIAAMHYTGMYGAGFAPNAVCLAQPWAIDPVWLAIIIGMGAFIMTATSIMVSMFDARLALQHAEMMRHYEVARDAAEEASSAKSEFLAVMSHELRTPLNAIIGFTEAMLYNMAGPVTEKQEAYLRDVRDAGQQLLSLVNDVLDLSKIEAKEIDVAPRQISMKENLDAVAGMIGIAAKENGVLLAMPNVNGSWTINADPRALKQILLNVMSNAVKFTDSGGLVAISTVKENGGTWISVSDTGVGIAGDELEHVTHPFHQCHTPEIRTLNGTGLGLAIVDGLINAHGGRLEIESESGAGTAVRLFFPD